MTGSTDSSEATFPVSGGPDLTYNGGIDAFVARVSPSGSGLESSGYLGGSALEIPRSIEVDGAGNTYIAGHTRSSESTFPVVNGPDLTYSGDTFGDVFVAKIPGRFDHPRVRRLHRRNRE